MKIVVLDGHTLAADGNSWDSLLPLGTVAVHDRSSPDEVGERSHGSAVLVTNKARIPASVIDASSQLRFIAVSATGYDCVDSAAAGRRGIPVSNVPEYGTDSVAQLTFALLLELCHHVGRHTEAVRAGEWARSPDFCFWKSPLIELVGKTMGVVGFWTHRPARWRTGPRLRHGCPRPQPLARRATPAYQPFYWADLDELFARSDVISLHCPLTPETAGLVNRERLRLSFLTRHLPDQHIPRWARRRERPGRGAERRAVGRRRRRRGLCRADPPGQPSAVGPQLPDHPPHRLGHARGPAPIAGGNRHQRRQLPRRAADERGESTRRRLES